MRFGAARECSRLIGWLLISEPVNRACGGDSAVVSFPAPWRMQGARQPKLGLVEAARDRQAKLGLGGGRQGSTAATVGPRAGGGQPGAQQAKLGPMEATRGPAVVGQGICARSQIEGRSARRLSPGEGSKGTKMNGRPWTRPDRWPPHFQRGNGGCASGPEWGRIRSWRLRFPPPPLFTP